MQNDGAKAWALAARLLRVGLLLALILAAFSWTPAGQPAGGSAGLRPVVVEALLQDVSPPLRSLRESGLPVTDSASVPAALRDRLDLPKARTHSFPSTEADPLVQAPMPEFPGSMPGVGFNFEGVNNRNTVLPPDTNGDVGPNHYVQWINLSLQIWSLDRVNKTATSVYGPVNGNVLWAGLGGACDYSNDGDPIVLYDHLANRWMVSQFALPYYPNGPFYQCIAVSQTADPTGSWHRYAFKISDTKLNDYPKFGVWPDGYYMTINQFEGDYWGGAGAVVFEREKMLAGLSARMVYFDLSSVNWDYGGMLPSDLDGVAPAAGTPNYFAEVDDASWIGPSDAMRIWEFHVDWGNPEASTFGLSGFPNQTLNVAGFTPLCLGTRYCVPQPSPGQKLDAIGDRLMFRLQYRNFGGYATLVTNHTVDAGAGRAGVRWYEVRRSGSSWSIYQQGTYAGGDTGLHRWMGSVALDSAGNLAAGYSASSTNSYPSIRYTGRLAGDPLGTLPQGEVILISGGGAQKDYSRWGDYSMLGVDPVDGCTFWYTNQYYTSNSSLQFHTRIGSFVFPNCLAGAKGSLTGRVTVNGSGLPISGAKVQAGDLSTFSDADGYYHIAEIAVGTYSVTASKYGYSSQQANNVSISPNWETTQNFSLAALPMVIVSGKVLDGSGQGWALYAKLQVSADGYAQTFFTNPYNGEYTLQLAQGVLHTFQVSAQTPGYLAQQANITPVAGGLVRNFSLLVDGSACTSLGYTFSGPNCIPQAGGLLAGNVMDANTASGVNGASVTSLALPVEEALTFATPEDAQLGDGFYVLFSSLTGTRSFIAEKTAYQAVTNPVNVQAGKIVQLDFNLPAGYLQASPAALNIRLPYTGTYTTTIYLENSGAVALDFSVSEVSNAQFPAAAGPFAPPARRTSPKALDALDAASVYAYTPPAVRQLPGGQLLAAWSTGLEHAWGVAVHPGGAQVWVGNALAGGGDGWLRAYNLDGEPLGQGIPGTASGAAFNADLTYDPFRQVFWQLNVAGDNCLEALDPQLQTRTGARICPPFGTSPRGLAFNPLDGSFYAGSWNDGILYHFRADGVLLDSKYLGLNIAGLAYNPSTQHLFVLSNASTGFDIYVVATPGYSILGGFDIPQLLDYGAAGLDLDCSGQLWLVDQVSAQVLQVGSGETGICAWNDISWLSVAPTSGSIAASGEQALSLAIDASGAPRGVNNVKLVLTTNTPYGPLEIPVTVFVWPAYVYLPLALNGP